MKTQQLAFVAIEPTASGFRGSLAVDGLLSLPGDPEAVLRSAAAQYEHSVLTMRSLIAEMRERRAAGQPIPARLMWQMGNAIFDLKDQLARFSLQLDDTYAHLVRDLGVKRKWLEKAIIFRRYLLREELIPATLNWGRCEKGTRRAAERLRNGLLPE